jgi:hypothetical protein
VQEEEALVEQHDPEPVAGLEELPQHLCEVGYVGGRTTLLIDLLDIRMNIRFR